MSLLTVSLFITICFLIKQYFMLHSALLTRYFERNKAMFYEIVQRN